MDAITLMERLGGEILSNKIRVTLNGEIVVVARLTEQDWEYTEQGQILANTHSNLAVDEAAAAPKTRKKGLGTVESAETPTLEVVEQAPAAE